MTATGASTVKPAGEADVAVVVTGHREGTLAAATFAALARAVDEARSHGLRVEVVGVLDRADVATTEVFESHLRPGGPIAQLAASRVVTTDHGDPGAARNEGVRASRAPWVCVLDADNLPTRSWLAAAHRRGVEHGAPCVVHPEHLVVFGERWQAWPQLPSDHPGFRVQNFYDRTYWDTFCLAAREVFEAVPYARTSAASGLGPEDWHWGMETVQAGFGHVVAAGTALLYRVKPSASVQEGHDEARSVLPPSALLTDLRHAAQDTHQNSEVGPDRRHPLVADVLSAGHLPENSARRWRPPWRRRTDAPASLAGGGVFHVAHYRALHADVLGLDDDEAQRHHESVGRAEGRRGVLTEAELGDLRRLDLDDYRELHPDLHGLTPPQLLHHYLVHGRAEGRAPAMTSEQRDAGRPVSLPDAVVEELGALHRLDPNVPDATAEALGALRHVGPPSDGTLTSGSRAWWDLVRRIGERRPETLVFTDGDGTPAAGSPAPRDARTLVVLTGVVGAPPPRRAPEGAVRLSDLEHWERLTRAEQHRLVATLVVQYGPSVVRNDGSAQLTEVARDFAAALRSVTEVVAPDGTA